MGTERAAVELRGVSKRFGETVAVDGLDLEVPSGSVFGFIGPNGSGKTTTLRMILRIYVPDSGSVRVLGDEHTDGVDDRVGYLPEERGLYKRMSVRDVLRFHAALKGKPRSDATIERWLERFGLAEHGGKQVEALSKGMGQKVQFIAAVVAEPTLAVLDEPFSGLDPVSLEVLKEAVLELRDRGTTVLFSTHDMAMAARLCDTITMIHRGKKVLDGTLGAIQSRYGEDTVRVRARAEDSVWASLPGVTGINDYNQYKELRLETGASHKAVLERLALSAEVELFELTRPSLHDIFVRIAGTDDDGPEAPAA